MNTTLGFIVMTPDPSLSTEQIRSHVRSVLPDEYAADAVIVLYDTGKSRIHALNDCLPQHWDEADCFAVSECDFLFRADPDALRKQLAAMNADVYCDCQLRGYNRRAGYVRYLCEQSHFFFFSEKAMLRMRTAETVDFICEMLSDESISIKALPDGIVDRKTERLLPKLVLLKYILDLRTVLKISAAASLAGTLTFIVLFLLLHLVRQTWSYVCAAGCIVCFHVFLFSTAVLLILWYRRSVQTEAKAHDHPYVQEIKKR